MTRLLCHTSLACAQRKAILLPGQVGKTKHFSGNDGDLQKFALIEDKDDDDDQGREEELGKKGTKRRKGVDLEW